MRMFAIVVSLFAASMLYTPAVVEAQAPAGVSPVAPIAVQGPSGPRVQEIRTVAPTFADSRTPVAYRRKETFTISTLALILVIAIVVLLVI